MADGDGREYPARPICAVGAVVRKDEAVLLIRRGRPPRAGEWTIPGGAVEIGETVEQAVRREIAEECGIEIELHGIAGVVDMIHRDDEGRVQYHYVIVDLAATYKGGRLAATSDAMDAVWAPFAELDRYPLIGKTHAVILRGLDMLSTTDTRTAERSQT